VEARNTVVKEGRLGTVGLVEIYCYYHMRTRENPPDTSAPAPPADAAPAAAEAAPQQSSVAKRTPAPAPQ
jgi:hypothetical protein